MIAVLLPFIYVGVCALVAHFGRHTRARYWGTFVLSLGFTPLLVGLALVVFRACPVAGADEPS